MHTSVLHRSILISIFTCAATGSAFLSVPAYAVLDPLSGVRMSLVTTQTLLAAPPLPSLRSGEGGLSVQGSYIHAWMSGTNPTVQQSYSGEFTGGAGGFGYSNALYKGISYFGVVNADRLTGTANVSDGTPVSEHRFNVMGGAAMLGAATRLLGTDASPVMFGVFGAAAGMHFDSDLEINGTHYKAQPYSYGPIAGVQMRIMIGNYVVRPYALMFKELSPVCKSVSSETGQVSLMGDCPGDMSSAAIDASFSAAGLVLGYKNFEVNVYSQMLAAAEALKDITLTHIAVSISF